MTGKLEIGFANTSLQQGQRGWPIPPSRRQFAVALIRKRICPALFADTTMITIIKRRSKAVV